MQFNSTQISEKTFKLSFGSETRRLPIALSSCPDKTYCDLSSAAASIFSIRDACALRFTYVDDDGDEITLSTGAELQIALEIFESCGLPVYKFNVRTSGSTPAPQQTGSVVHRFITCDECGMSPIQGVRYKCSVRRDFDLCAACEGHKSQPYPMLKIYTADQAPVQFIVTLHDAQFPGVPIDESIPPRAHRGRGYFVQGQGHGHGHGHGRRHHGRFPQGHPVDPAAIYGFAPPTASSTATAAPEQGSQNEGGGCSSPRSALSDMPNKVVEAVSAAVSTAADIANAVFETAAAMSQASTVPSAPPSAVETRCWKINSGPSGTGSVNWISKKGETMFHFSPRPAQACIVLNTWLNGSWGPEERIESPDFSTGVEAYIKATDRGFEIYLAGDSAARYTYEHRLPWGDFMDVSKHPEWRVESISNFVPSASVAAPSSVPATVEVQQEAQRAQQAQQHRREEEDLVTLYSTELRFLADMGFDDIPTVLPVLQATITTPVSRHPELNGKPRPEEIQQAVAVLLSTSLR